MLDGNFWFWIWLGILVLSVIIELVTAELVSIWIAGAALVTMLITLAIPPKFGWIGIIIFTVLSVVLVVATRSVMKKFLQKNRRKTNVDSIVGKKVFLTKEVNETQNGEVKIGDVHWTVITHDNSTLRVGEAVIIESIEGNKLIVSSFENKEAQKEEN